MKDFPILYKRTETRNIQFWKIWVEEKFNNGNGVGIIHIDYGQKDTDSPQHTQDSILNGKNFGKKNATTAFQQACKDAESKWKKKKKSGGYHENIKNIDRNSFIKPMLAYNYNDYKDGIEYPVLLDRKYNGMRIVATEAGLHSRKGEECKSIPHIEKALQSVFEKYPAAMIDGEAYNHSYRYKLNEIMKLLRKTVKITPEILKESEKKIKFYVYDGYGFDGVAKNTILSERRTALKKLLKDIPYIVVVDGQKVYDEIELMKYYTEYLFDGYEGGMIRVIDSPYENKRTKYLLKYKPQDDDEAIILDINKGTGNWANTGKVITLSWKDKQFDATFKGSIEQGMRFLNEKKKWIGKEVTFIYNGLTGKGVPNYARVDYNNCIKK